MNPLLNFFASLRRYKAASALNIAGLSVAFASFMIIMTQVGYDLGFDRHYKDTERIFRLENRTFSEHGEYNADFSRPIAEKITESVPNIEKTGLLCFAGEHAVYAAQTGTNSTSGPYEQYTAGAEIPALFELEYIWGNADRFAEPNTVLVSEEVSRALYGTENPVGRTLVIEQEDEHPLEIVGVYKNFPRNSSFKSAGIFRFIGDENINNFQTWCYHCYLKLDAPKHADEVQSKLRKAMAELFPEELESEEESEETYLRLTPLSKLHYQTDIQFDRSEKATRSTTYSLLTIAVLIIVIAAINFVNFSVALVPVRIRSINTRKILGASEGTIRRNMIAEAVGSAVAAFAVALLIVELFASSPMAALVSTDTKIGSNLRILLGTALTAVITGIVSGVYPAFYSTSFQPALVLKGSFGLSPKGRRLRTLLISVQYIVSIALIAVAIAIHLQNRYMQRFDMGFERENIVNVQFQGTTAAQRNLLKEKLESHPDIKGTVFSAAVVSEDLSIWTRDYKGEVISFRTRYVDPGFPALLGIGIVEGRDFLESDTEKPHGTFIFNETARKQYGIAAGDDINGTEIVGIARDFNFRPLQHTLEPFAFIVPGTRSPSMAFKHLYIRISGENIPRLIGFIDETSREIVPDFPPDIRFLDDAIGQLYLKERNFSTLIALFSLLSVLISVMGVFGLILFETQYRRKEIGVRKVFGATAGEILRLFNRGFVRTVLLCFVIAAPAAWFIIRRWQENFAYKAPLPVWIFLIALLAVLAVTALTISLQSYRTATENPVRSIKTE